MPIGHEQLVGMVGQFPHAPEIAIHQIQGDVFPDGHRFVIHQRADRVLGIGQGGLQPGAMPGIHGIQHPLQDVARQVGGQVRQFVRVELCRCRLQFGLIHAGDEAFANCVGDLQQDFPILVRPHQLPDRQAILQWQGFQNIGDIGHMKTMELALQFAQVLAVQDLLFEGVTRGVAAFQHVLDQVLFAQQIGDLLQDVLQVVAVGRSLDRSCFHENSAVR